MSEKQLILNSTLCRVVLAVWVTLVACNTIICQDTQSATASIVEEFDGVRPSLQILNSASLSRIKNHVRSDRSPYRGRRSELIKLIGNRGGERVLATQDISPVAAIPELEIRSWVRGNRIGFQMMVRVRLPRSRDEAGAPLSLYILGDRYSLPGHWQQLGVADFEVQLSDRIRAMRAAHSGRIDAGEAYVDQVAFNVFGGAGENQIWIDDLSIAAGIPINPAGSYANSKRSALAEPRLKHQVIAASYQAVAKERDNWMPRVLVYRGQSFESVDRNGFNAVWFGQTPSKDELDQTQKRNLRVICPPPQDVDDLGSYADAWHLSIVNHHQSEGMAALLRRKDPLRRPLVAMSSVEGEVDIRVDERIVKNSNVAARRWMTPTNKNASRWLPIRNQIRQSVLSGYSGFVFDPEALGQKNTLYRQSIAELFNLELSMLRPWIKQGESLERFQQGDNDSPFHVTGLISPHAGLIWVTSREQRQAPGQAVKNEIDLQDASYRDVFYLQPGSLEPALNRRIAGGVRITLNHDKPDGLLLLSNQPQILRAHTEHLQSMGKRYNELLVNVIRYELLELDRALTNDLKNAALAGHLRQELHGLHSRIAPLLDSRDALVDYRQLDHILDQLERVQRLTDVRY